MFGGNDSLSLREENSGGGNGRQNCYSKQRYEIFSSGNAGNQIVNGSDRVSAPIGL